MFSQVSYNVVVERFKAFADGHYLIKRFSHGQIDVTDIMKDAEYPWMHIVPVSMNPSTGTRSFSFDIIFADIPRDKEDKTEYQRESLSDCMRLAEDLLAEIQNGNIIFGQDVELEQGASISPFMEEYTHVLTGVTLSLTMTFPWNWDACTIPSDWSAGGTGSGGSGGTGGGGASILLKVNDVDNVIQTILNITAGANMTITDMGDGRVKFDATGDIGTTWGTIGGLLADQIDLQSALNLKADISSLADVAFSGDYDDLINTPSIPAAQVNSDWNSSSGLSQILNKPSIPSVLNDLTDVDTAGQSLKKILYYDGTKWIPYLLSSVAYSGKYDDLSGLPSIPKSLAELIGSGTSAGQIIQWSGTTWAIVSPSWSLEKLSDVNVSGVTDGQVLTWDDINGEWIPTTLSFTQVNSDWNASTGLAKILNKPTIPAAQIQSDWTQVSTSGLDYIKNKPTLPVTIGDMTKAVYDTNNDGIVDFAEALKTEVRNSTGATLRKGTIIYLSGSTGNLPNAVLAKANAEATSAQTFGVVYADIANNSNGFVITLGQIDTLDTRSTATNPFTTDTLVDGQVIYLSPTTAGYITNVKPSAPYHVVYVGYVIRTSPTNGTIVYRIQNGYELDEIHDVKIVSPVAKNFMIYNSSSTLWENKSVDSTYLNDRTSVGGALIALPNPSAISYIKINADNTISVLTTAQLKSAIGDTIPYGAVYLSSLILSSTRYGAIAGGFATSLDANIANRQFTIPINGTIKNLYITTSNVQSATGSLVASVVKNGVVSSVSVTFTSADGAGATKSDTSNTLSVSAGDKIVISFVNNATISSATIVSGAFIIERI